MRELHEVAVLGGGADVERVTHRVCPQPNRILDRGDQRAQRLVVGWDLGLAVELDDERHPPCVAADVLGSDANLEDDG